MITIAIDFDDTLTRDAELWRGFIALAKKLGHRVICVTSRRGTVENVETVEEWMRSHDIDLAVWFTNLRSKVDYMKSIDVKVDIWIDDDLKRAALGF